MKSPHFLLLAVIAAVTFVGSKTFAIAPFKKAFSATYVKESGDKDFQTAFKKSGCYTCHVKGKKKDVVNAYGWELAKLIEGSAKDRIDAARKNGKDAKKAEGEKLLKELKAALKKVEATKAPSGTTYGELFKAHELPSAEGAKSVRK